MLKQKFVSNYNCCEIEASSSSWAEDNTKESKSTSFPKRGDWATHDAKWRGNWSPYIPRNLLLRYSKEGDLVLDQFAGGGTTLVEAKLLHRNIIGVDVNTVALERCKEKTDFEWENAGKVYLKQGDARNLDFIKDESIDFVCTHHTIDLHSKIIEKKNFVWWGWWAKPQEKVALESFVTLKAKANTAEGFRLLLLYSRFLESIISMSTQQLYIAKQNHTANYATKLNGAQR